MQNDAKLLPCPFCGKTPPHVHLSHVTGRIFCEGCGAEGPWSPYFNDGGWNTRAPQPAPVTAREAEPVAWAAYDDSLPVDVDLRQDIADQWCADGIDVRPLYAHPPQPSETVAEALTAADRFFREAMPKMNIADSFLDANAIDAWNKAELAISAALRALSSGEASRD